MNVFEFGKNVSCKFELNLEPKARKSKNLTNYGNLTQNHSAKSLCMLEVQLLEALQLQTDSKVKTESWETHPCVCGRL